MVGSVDGAWGHIALVWRTELKQRSAVAVVAKAQAVLSESDLLWAMFDVGYFLPNTPRVIKPARRIATIIALNQWIKKL